MPQVFKNVKMQDVRRGDLVRTRDGEYYAINLFGQIHLQGDEEGLAPRHPNNRVEIIRPGRREVPVFEYEDDPAPIGFASDPRAAEALLREIADLDRLLVGVEAFSGSRRKHTKFGGFYGEWRHYEECAAVADVKPA